MLRLPNFIIVGAPKCGTTAMAQYLAAHPKVFFSDPKEPYFFCPDFPSVRGRSGITDWSDYVALFSPAKPAQTMIGEGSTLYLASDNAIAEISRVLPGAKMIAMVRDPVELAISFHGQQRKVGRENQADFRLAWALQESRRRSGRFSTSSRCSELLQYSRIASVGSQLQRFCALVPEERRLIIRQEDFLAAPRETYESVLCFLGLESDGRSFFPKINKAGSPRAPWLLRCFRSSAGRYVSSAVKSLLPSKCRLPVAALKERILYRTKVSASREDTFADISAELEPERALLEMLASRKYSDA